MSKFSPGPGDWWLRQPGAKVYQEVGRSVLSVPVGSRLERLRDAAPEMYDLLKIDPDDAWNWRARVMDLLARIDGEETP